MDIEMKEFKIKKYRIHNNNIMDHINARLKDDYKYVFSESCGALLKIFFDNINKIQYLNLNYNYKEMNNQIIYSNAHNHIVSNDTDSDDDNPHDIHSG